MRFRAQGLSTAVAGTLEALLATPIVVVLHSHGLAGRAPLWVSLLPILLFALLQQEPVLARLDRFGPRLALFAHLAVTGWLIYAIGWGPLLPLAFALVSTQHLRRSRARLWRPAALGTLAVVAAGQVAVALGWADSYIAPTPAQVAGLLGGLVTALLIRSLGRAGEEGEQARAELAASEQRLAYDAAHDQLTGLINRSEFLRALDEAARTGDVPAVLFIDLDGFKPINDTYGHRYGDAVLRHAAQRLRAGVRSDDLVGRLGGDEFAVALTGPHATERAAAVAQRLRADIRLPIIEDGLELQVAASIGVATPETGNADTTALMHQADLAMYEAKRRRDEVSRPVAFLASDDSYVTGAERLVDGGPTAG
ncbi:diguanylate cyclase domain-containing protein [Actinoplanes sp. CA-054009]